MISKAILIMWPAGFIVPTVSHHQRSFPTSFHNVPSLLHIFFVSPLNSLSYVSNDHFPTIHFPSNTSLLCWTLLRRTSSAMTSIIMIVLRLKAQPPKWHHHWSSHMHQLTIRAWPQLHYFCAHLLSATTTVGNFSKWVPYLGKLAVFAANFPLLCHNFGMLSSSTPSDHPFGVFIFSSVLIHSLHFYL